MPLYFERKKRYNKKVNEEITAIAPKNGIKLQKHQKKERK